MRENGMDWCVGDDFILVYVSHGKWKTQLDKLLQTDPDKIRVTHINNDGSYLAEIPKEWVNIRKPRYVSPEQRELYRERMINLNKNRNTKEEGGDID